MSLDPDRLAFRKVLLLQDWLRDKFRTFHGRVLLAARWWRMNCFENRLQLNCEDKNSIACIESYLFSFTVVQTRCMFCGSFFDLLQQRLLPRDHVSVFGGNSYILPMKTSTIFFSKIYLLQIESPTLWCFRDQRRSQRIDLRPFPGVGLHEVVSSECRRCNHKWMTWLCKAGRMRICCLRAYKLANRFHSDARKWDSHPSFHSTRSLRYLKS